MDKYLSHISAAMFWDVPNLHTALGCSKAEMDTYAKPHYTFSESQKVSYCNSFHSHLHKLPLPKEAVLIAGGTRVASPELTFLQMAQSLDIQHLILLALQMCSHPPGQPDQAITSKQKLSSFFEKVSGHRGYRNGARAIKYINNGSASVLESLAFMLLTLPHALGGFALAPALLNQEIILKKEAGIRLKQRRCFVDLYYREKRLAVEYDSFKYHKSPADQGRDALRAEALKRQGIDVVRLSTIQLYDEAAFEDFAFNLSRHLGKRLQIRASTFNRMHGSLRFLLPRFERNKSDW